MVVTPCAGCSDSSPAPPLSRSTSLNRISHWKTKGCTPWSKQYFTDRLVGQSVTAGDGIEVRIDRLETFDGDVELGNRKGKLITIYDVDMHLAWVATSSSSSGSSSSSSPTTIAKGKLRFPEVSHEIEDQGDDYTWETTLDSESDEGVEEKQRQVAYKAVKKDLAEKLLPAFKDFRATLVDKHARDLGHEDQQSGPNSGASTPAAAAAAAAAAPAAKAEQSKPKAAAASSSAVSTSTDVVELSAAQACSQSDLWDLLTNPARIPMWTRSPADFSLTPGAPFSLFGGNVRGKVLSVNEPSKLVMAWRPPTWEPKDHFGELELRLSEGEGSTDLKIRLQGVPQGEEESSRKGLEEMYMNGLKRLGLSAVI